MGLSGNAENPQYMVANPDAPRHILRACSHFPTAPCNGIQPFIIACGNGLDAPPAPSLYRTVAMRRSAQPRE